MDPRFIREFARELTKLAFQVSQFSGPLSYGRFKMESSQPGFRSFSPVVRQVRGHALPVNPGSMSPVVKMAYAGFGTNISSIRSPKSVLSRTSRVGAARLTPPPGPSIAAQVKPVDVGKGSPVGPSLPGAIKAVGD